MSYTYKFKGPSSSKRNKRGGKSRFNKFEINIADFDTDSCNFGVVEGIVNGNTVTVRDLQTNGVVHCTTHKMNTRRFSKGMAVVFSYIRGEKTGEIIASYNSDRINDLCHHFKIGSEKASKAMGFYSEVNNDITDDVPIARTISVIDKPVFSDNFLIGISDDSESEYESEVEYKTDRFGNTINDDNDTTIDVNYTTLPDAEQNDDSSDANSDNLPDKSDEPSANSTKFTKFKQNKKHLQNSRSNARHKKQSFLDI